MFVNTINSVAVIMKIKFLFEWKIHPLFYIAIAICFSVVNLVTTSLVLGNPMANNNSSPPLIALGMRDSFYLNVIVGEIVLSGYILIDILLDMFSNTRKFVFSLSQMLNFSLCFLFLVSSWAIFLYAIPTQDYYILRALNQIRIFSSLCATSTFICHFNSYFRRNPIIVIAILTVACGYQVRNFTPNTAAYSILVATAMSMFAGLILLWLLHLYKKKRNGQPITEDDWKCNLYLSLCVCLTAIIQIYIVGSAKAKLYEDYGVSELVGYELCFAGWTVVQSMYQTRLTRREVQRYQVNLMTL